MAERRDVDPKSVGVAPTLAAANVAGGAPGSGKGGGGGAPATAGTKPSLLAMTECGTCHVSTPIARFCTACGAALAPRRFCGECGARLTPGTHFCEGCGAKVA